MDFRKIIADLSAMGLNLYDFALYTPDGIASHRFIPCSNCHNSYSVAKVFIMTALGMLYDDGKLLPEDPVSRYLSLPQNADPRFHSVLIDHALTHRIGFDKGFLDIDTEDPTTYPSEDYLSIVLSRPLAHVPGTHSQYSDAAFYLLSRLIAAVAGEHADVLLNRRLLRPLRFHEAAWSRCPHDHPIGATGLYIGAQDMVKLGALYLEGGVYDGQRLLSREWTQMAIDRQYELHPLAPGNPDSDLTGKWGMYGQLLAFSRKKHFAIALHAHMDIRRDGSKLIEYFSA
ncbi:MAG: beta-lactamase family protein [Clostridia bacterium]|nr:beta-lactamase family protein [Clostridia bacterium]